MAKRIPACRGSIPSEPCRKARLCCLVVTGEPEARHGVLAATGRINIGLKVGRDVLGAPGDFLSGARRVQRPRPT
jgi:hypothetical protein